MAALVVAAALTFVVAAVLRPVLVRFDVLDVPNSRSSHAVPVLRGGGVACMVAAAVVVGVLEPVGLLMVVVPLALGCIGFVDDVRTLSPVLRLGLQAVAGLATLVVVSSVSDGVGVLLAVVGVVLFVSIVNAFNFMDGINGISGLNVVVAGGWYLLVSRDDGLVEAQLLSAVLVGVACGFLPWNVPIARQFLGDSGSYFFGGSLALLAWVIAAETASVSLALAPLALYLADTGSTLMRRVGRGGLRSVLTAHRDHVYQALADRWGHLAAAAYTAALSVVVCALVWSTEAVTSLLGTAAVLVLYLMTPRLFSMIRGVWSSSAQVRR